MLANGAPRPAPCDLGQKLLNDQIRKIMSSRGKELRIGILIIVAVMLLLGGLFLAMQIPGKVGQFTTQFVLKITTPIILEISFATLGIIIVLALAWYNTRNANEFVEIDFPDAPPQQDDTSTTNETPSSKA